MQGSRVFREDELVSCTPEIFGAPYTLPHATCSCATILRRPDLELCGSCSVLFGQLRQLGGTVVFAGPPVTCQRPRYVTRVLARWHVPAVVPAALPICGPVVVLCVGL